VASSKNKDKPERVFKSKKSPASDSKKQQRDITCIIIKHYAQYETHKLSFDSDNDNDSENEIQ
jgi:hypothetical protein